MHMTCYTDQDLVFAALHAQAHVQYQDRVFLNQSFANVENQSRPMRHHFSHTCNDHFLQQLPWFLKKHYQVLPLF